MKKSIFVFVSIIVLYNNLISQNDDHQWFILDQIGKQGEANSLSQYPLMNAINPVFKTSGISVPDLDNDPRAGNDLFAIFADGDHFSTRGGSLTGMDATLFAGPFSSNEEHYFHNRHGAPISYRYLTNRYEMDDLPKKVALQNFTDPLPPDVNNIRPNVPDIISANHDVVFTRDITIVVNYELLKRQILQEGLNTGNESSDNRLPEVKLVFNGYELISRPGQLGTENLFDPSPVFVDGSGTSVPEFPLGMLT